MRVLVIGATGYVGSRLVPALLEAGHEVVAGARREGALAEHDWAGAVEHRYVDMGDTVSVHLAVREMDAVVYLVHSLTSSDFVARDREAAQHLAKACDYAEVGRVVYLSGLVPDGELSDHLASRLEVEQILLAAATPTTVLRASMLVGAGSTSFEVLRRISERVPVTAIPRWMSAQIQPIATDDVISFLVGALDGEVRNRSYDVGGDEVLTYAELIVRFTRAAGLVRPQVPVLVAPTWLVGDVVALVTGLDRPTVKALVREPRARHGLSRRRRPPRPRPWSREHRPRDGAERGPRVGPAQLSGRMEEGTPPPATTPSTSSARAVSATRCDIGP